MKKIYQDKLEFPGGEGVQNKKPSVGGVCLLDIFWNAHAYIKLFLYFSMSSTSKITDNLTSS